MIAALYHGNSKGIAVLLNAGIPAAPSRKIRYDASALAHAVMSNDPAMIQRLLSKGANPNHGKRMLGGQPVTVLNLAGCLCGDDFPGLCRSRSHPATPQRFSIPASVNSHSRATGAGPPPNGCPSVRTL